MTSSDNKKQKRKSTTCRFTDDLNEELSRLSKLCGISKNAFIQQYLWKNLIETKQRGDNSYQDPSQETTI